MRWFHVRSHLARGGRTLALAFALLGLALGFALWGSRSAADEGSKADKPKEAEAKGEVKAKGDDQDWEAPADAQKVANPIKATGESLARGEKIYTKTCASCHGVTGKGDGKSAKILAKKPADLRNDVPHHTDGDLFWKITEGKKPMPSFKKDLKPEQRWDVINYLRMLTTTEAPGDSAKKGATMGQGS